MFCLNNLYSASLMQHHLFPAKAWTLSNNQSINQSLQAKVSYFNFCLYIYNINVKCDHPCCLKDDSRFRSVRSSLYFPLYLLWKKGEPRRKYSGKYNWTWYIIFLINLQMYDYLFYITFSLFLFSPAFLSCHSVAFSPIFLSNFFVFC
jgi:hypothetical protein